MDEFVTHVQQTEVPKWGIRLDAVRQVATAALSSARGSLKSPLPSVRSRPSDLGEASSGSSLAAEVSSEQHRWLRRQQQQRGAQQQPALTRGISQSASSTWLALLPSQIAESDDGEEIGFFYPATRGDGGPRASL